MLNFIILLRILVLKAPARGRSREAAVQFCLRTGRHAATGEGHREGFIVHFALPSVQE